MTLDLEPIKARVEDADEDGIWVYTLAHGDVPALIAEVERLRGIVTAGIELADQWQTRSRGFSGPPDDMPDEATYYGVQVASEFGAILRNDSGSAS